MINSCVRQASYNLWWRTENWAAAAVTMLVYLATVSNASAKRTGCDDVERGLARWRRRRRAAVSCRNLMHPLYNELMLLWWLCDACLPAPAWHWRYFCSAWWDMMITKLHYIFAAFPHTHTPNGFSPHFHFHFSVEWSALYFCMKTNPIFRSKTTLLPIVCCTTCTATPYPKSKF